MSTRTATVGLSAALALAACGGREQETPEDNAIGTSHAALCAGARERHDGLETTSGCPFEQQVRNIGIYGEEFAPQTLLDATGEPIAEVTYSCDGWWLGTDPSGVLITLDSDTGRVVSHGAVHAGFPTSSLSNQLPVPFVLR